MTCHTAVKSCSLDADKADATANQPDRMPSPLLLHIPLEIRLIIYRFVLLGHCQVVKQRQQPNNDHLHVLHTCTQIYYEADHILRQYVSLCRERQMLAFNQYATESQKARVRHADVANDGRTIEDLSSNQVILNTTPRFQKALNVGASDGSNIWPFSCIGRNDLSGKIASVRSSRHESVRSIRRVES